MNRIYGLAAIAGLGMLLSGAAHAATLAAGNSSVTGIGDDISSVFDQLNIAGTSGLFLDAGQIGVNIGTGAFVVGPNCSVCAPTSGSINEPFSVNGSPTQNFVINWSWSSNGAADFLTLAIATGTLDFGDYVAALHLSTNSLSGTGGSVPFGLTADIVPTPLPAALPLSLRASARWVYSVGAGSGRLLRPDPKHLM